jgi:cytochrome c oxidase assembly protein subunit 15
MVGNIRFEHSHRLIAGFVLILISALSVWLRRSEPRKWVRWLGYSALMAVLGQAVLGGLTVLFFLPAPISVGHACLAQLVFCLTVIMAKVTGERWRALPPAAPDLNTPSLPQLSAFTAAGIFLQLMMGAAFRHNGLGIVPHLAGAVVVTGLILWTVYRVISVHSGQPALLRPAAWLGGLLTVQLLLGGASYLALQVTKDAPQPLPIMVWPTVAHVAGGALTLACSVWLAIASHRLLSVSESCSEDHRGRVPIST